MKITIIGATGDMGRGLALRWAKAGHQIIVGSRQEEKAALAAREMCEEAGCGGITGMENSAAAREAELVVVSVPSGGHRAILEGLRDVLKDRPVLDVTIPMAFKPLRYAPPAEGSNALEAQAVLGEEAKIAAAFHTISATILCDLSRPAAGDVLVVANDKELRETVIGLAGEIGFRAFHAGGLGFSPTVESLTPMLIGINHRTGKKDVGISLTGL